MSSSVSLNKKNNFKKDVFWNSLGSALNGFNSLIFLIIVTRINGVFDAGIFTYAFSISAIFNIIGVYSGRVYHVTDRSSLNDNDFFISKLITCFVVLISSLIFVLLNSYSFTKTIIVLTLCLYRNLEAFSEVLYGYYQRDDNLYKVGISLTLKSLLCIIVFLIADLISKNLLFSSIIMVIIYLIVMISYDFKVLKSKNINLKNFELDKIKLFFKNGFSTFLLLFLVSLLINVPRYMIDLSLTEEDNAIWGILIMPGSIMLMLSQFCIHPLLNSIFVAYEKKNYDNYKKLVNKIILFILLIGIPVIIVAYILGIPVLEFVYGIDLKGFKLSFMIIMIGAILYGAQTILYNVLIGIRKVKEQIIAYICLIVFYIIINIIFIEKWELFGASLGYLLIMLINFIIYEWTYLKSAKKIKKKNKKNI